MGQVATFRISDFRRALLIWADGPPTGGPSSYSIVSGYLHLSGEYSGLQTLTVQSYP